MGLFVLRRRLSVGYFVFAVVAWVGTQLGTTVAKYAVGRPRPNVHLWLVTAHGWSWPSGHTATATLVFTILATLVWVRTPKAAPRALAVAIAIAAICVVAFSRIELGVHWTTDVLANAWCS